MLTLLLKTALFSVLFQTVYGIDGLPDNPVIELKAPLKDAPLKAPLKDAPLKEVPLKAPKGISPFLGTPPFLGGSNPLVDLFAKKITQKFLSNKGEIPFFKLASGGGIFKNLMSKKPESGCPKLPFVPPFLQGGGHQDPLQVLKSLGRNWGSILFKKGKLNKENLPELVEKLFQDICKAFREKRGKGLEGCFQAMFDATEAFCTKMGMKWKDIAGDMGKEWMGLAPKFPGLGMMPSL